MVNSDPSTFEHDIFLFYFLLWYGTYYYFLFILQEDRKL